MAYNKDTKLYEGFIYKITNNINGNSYIGQTRTTLTVRWNNHKCSYEKYDYALYKAMRKYGIENFIFSEIEMLSDDSEENLINILNEREIYWISFYNTFNKGYNETIGGYNQCQRNIRTVKEYSLSCDYINSYSSVQDASYATGYNNGDIKNCCERTKIKRVGNRIFRYEDDDLSVEEIKEYKALYQKIIQYSISGKMLNCFETIKDVSTWLKNNIGENIQTNTIYLCMNGNLMSAYGYVWRKENDQFDKYVTPDNKYDRKIEKRHKITGKLIDTYENINFESNISKRKAIRECCDRKKVFTNGFHWCYEGDFDFSRLNNKKNRPVNMYSLNGEYLYTFENSTEATIYLNVKSSCFIQECCNNKKKTAYGYIWKFYYDDVIQNPNLKLNK